jgi:hypothetical protein
MVMVHWTGAGALANRFAVTRAILTS